MNGGSSGGVSQQTLGATEKKFTNVPIRPYNEPTSTALPEAILSDKNDVDNHGSRLDSWKAIAVYLDRHVRTVRRWESEGLPVHRIHHKSRDSVYCYRGEIDRWLADRSPHDHERRHSRRFSVVLRWVMVAAGVGAVGAVWFALRKDSSQPASARTVSIAVLPFQDLAGQPGDGRICEALTEELTTRLGRADQSRLRVLARSATQQYISAPKRARDAGRELDVDYVIEGAFLRVDSRIRVTVRVIRVFDESQIWGDAYDHRNGDRLDFQETVTGAIAEQIRDVVLGTGALTARS